LSAAEFKHRYVSLLDSEIFNQYSFKDIPLVTPHLCKKSSNVDKIRCTYVAETFVTVQRGERASYLE